VNVTVRKGTGRSGDLAAGWPTSTCTTVSDLWAERWRRREATGDMIIVRYADDFIVGSSTRKTPDVFWMRCEKRLGSSRCRSMMKDAADRVRTISGAEPQRRGLGQAGNVQLPGLHLHQRKVASRQIPGQKGSREATVCG